MSRSVVLQTRHYVAFGALLLLAGCSSMFGDRGREPVDGIDTKALREAGYHFDERGAQRALPPSDGKPSVVLEVRNGKRHLERIPLPPDKPTFIQDIVDDAKLVDKIGRIQVTILRPTGANNPPIRMDADFDTETKRLVIGQNYAVQPNDTVIVSKDTRSWLDNFSILPKKSTR
jgi:hypothetical protein